VSLCLYVITFWLLVSFCKTVYCRSVPCTFFIVIWRLEVKYGIEWKLKKRETCSVNEPFPAEIYHLITRAYHISSSRPGTRSNISCITFTNMYLSQRNSSYSWYSLLILQLLKISLLSLQIYLFDVCKWSWVIRSIAEESWKINLSHRHISRLCLVAWLGGYLSVCHCRGPGSFPGQLMWNFWCTKWHCDRLFLPPNTSLFRSEHNYTNGTYLFVHICTPVSYSKDHAFNYVPAMFYLLHSVWCAAHRGLLK